MVTKQASWDFGEHLFGREGVVPEKKMEPSRFRDKYLWEVISFCWSLFAPFRLRKVMWARSRLLWEKAKKYWENLEALYFIGLQSQSSAFGKSTDFQIELLYW